MYPQYTPQPVDNTSEAGIATVAALYVDPRGVYADLPGIEVWDEARDARLYAGPWPVVAHPPCNKWSPLAYINQRRLPDYHLGDDGGCFAAALSAVQTFSGVLEHPRSSVAWATHGLPRALRGSWQAFTLDGSIAWATVADQGTYGHRAQKATQLVYVGNGEPAALDWRESPSRVVVSGFLHRTGTDESRRVRPREAASTPPPFRDVLLAIARSAATTRD